MTRLLGKVGAVLGAAALLAVGLSGAYSYGRNYYVHRGFSSLVQFRRAGTGRLEKVQFYSPALHRNADYLVYLPPHYNPARRYPVYYLLHGMPGQPRVFVDIANMDVRLDNQLSLAHARPMILVYPDGRIGGSVFSDSEWANTPSGAFESYVIEVMHNVDQHFATIPRRQARVIAGFSSGAYGAMNIALHHLSDFANVQAWSGYFTQTRTGVFGHANQVTLAYNSPVQYIRRLGRALVSDPLRVYMFVGRSDGSSRQQLPMARGLQASGAEVRYTFYPGGHDWSVWYPRLNQMLDLASQDSAHPPTAAAIPLHPLTAATPAPGVSGVSGVSGAHHHHRSELRLVGALLLALISAALINIGFILQQRGHARARATGRDRLASGFREPVWLSGQVVGWIGFGGQILAVALAPLTLVQAFSAGSLALSVPLAARAFGHRVRAPQLAAIGVITLSLISLPIGFGGGHGQFHPGLLIACALLVALGGATVAPRAGSAALAVAAGAFYGAADAAIKAASIGVRFHGASVLTGWTLLAGLCTFGGFVAFQAALRDGDEVRPLTLMNAFTALAAVALGMLAFGEPLGSTPAAGALHVVAMVLVLACVRPLAGAQQRLAEGAPLPDSSHAPRSWLVLLAPGRLAGLRVPSARHVKSALRIIVTATLGAGALIVCAIAAVGLLYGMRQLGWLAVGPPVPDALPLLQLAGFDAQPLARVVVAALLAGLAVGVGMIRVPRRRRVVVAAVFGLLVMLLASDASYALARNLRLGPVLLDRSPTLGPWLEALVLALARALPGAIPKVRVPAAVPRPRFSAPNWRVLAPVIGAGVAAALAVALLVPNGHARAQTRTRPVIPSVSSDARFASSPPAAPAAAASPRRRSHARRALRRATRRTPGRLLTVYFYSRALHRVTDYLVYLPAGYSPARRLPVFYMLHGMPGRPLAFTVNAQVEVKLQRLIDQRLLAPMILVFPDGRIDGNTQTDSEWANTRAGAFESYVVDVVHAVDRRFATLPYRQDRAIAGLSAGAYGALNVGLHHVDLFGLIQVWSGYFTQTHDGVFSHASRAWLAYNSPLDYVRTMKARLAAYALRVFLYVGNGDGDASPIGPMAWALADAGAKVQAEVFPGGHNWNLWSGRIDQMLIMASRYFR
jgi:enterochelin esterase-like enzyme/drug/metabolite transporter (DMT)-like permease